MNIAAVLLAAGASMRFGAPNKLLAPLAGTPLVRHAAEALAASSLAEIVAVTGPDADAVTAALGGLPLKFVHNARFADGMGSSIAAGVCALASDADGVLIVPGDMPGVTANLIAVLVAAFECSGGMRPVFPTLADGRQSPPVLWPRACFTGLSQLSGPQGGKALLTRVGGIPVPIGDAQLLIDIDTVDELAAAASSFSRGNT